MRLLLAEDERELSDALVAILKHNNYSVDAVYNGEDALNYLEADNYDGAILDIMMPKMDGITVLKNIRAQGNDVPVLILTAKSEVDDRVLGLDSGADGKADGDTVPAGRRKRRNGRVQRCFRGKRRAERVKQKMLPCGARKHFFVEISRKLCYAISAAERRRGTANNGRRFGPHFRKEVSTCQLL